MKTGGLPRRTSRLPSTGRRRVGGPFELVRRARRGEPDPAAGGAPRGRGRRRTVSSCPALAKWGRIASINNFRVALFPYDKLDGSPSRSRRSSAARETAGW